jgi:hypothetical protein
MIENEAGTSFFVHEETQSVDSAKGNAATYRHTAPIYLPLIPPGRYVLKVRAESSGAPGRVAVQQIPIAIR